MRCLEAWPHHHLHAQGPLRARGRRRRVLLGQAKKYYRWRRHKPEGADTFTALVVESLSRTVLPLTTMRGGFVRQVRAYKRAYRTGQSNERTDIERMWQLFKTHRNAYDFARTFSERS
mmetsp:Transcript_9240/g.25282  ORF Transcript_9240/g.25282 Transcript_9240/m.25282 type:complete len:118 (+) Transcript_9240:564-917(+)